MSKDVIDKLQADLPETIDDFVRKQPHLYAFALKQAKGDEGATAVMLATMQFCLACVRLELSHQSLGGAPAVRELGRQHSS